MKLKALMDYDIDTWMDAITALDDDHHANLVFRHGGEAAEGCPGEFEEEANDLCDELNIRFTVEGTRILLSEVARNRRNVTIRFIPGGDREQVEAAKLNDDLFVIVTDCGNFIPWILPVGKYRCESLGMCLGWNELGEELGYVFECMSKRYNEERN